MIDKSYKSKFLIILLIAISVLPYLLTASVLAANAYPYTSNNAEISSALDYLRGQQGTDGSISDFATSAWAVMAIKAAGEDPNSWRVGSNPTIVDYLSANVAMATTVNDYSRTILAITAAGKDPASFGGKNFLKLLESAYDGTQIGNKSLLNDDFWGVMALVAAGVKPTSSDIIQSSLSFILNNQNNDGGWSYGVGQSSDIDDTAAAVMALTAAGESVGSTPIANAITYIKNNQASNGGLESWGSTNSATDSWAVDSIVAGGQNPAGIAWQYNGTGNNPVNDLLTFQNRNGSFNWTSKTPSNTALMTSYAIVALCGTHYPVAKIITALPDTTTAAATITTTTTPTATAPLTTIPATIVPPALTATSIVPTITATKTTPKPITSTPTLTTPESTTTLPPTPINSTLAVPLSQAPKTNCALIGGVTGAVIIIGIIIFIILRKRGN